MALKRITEEEMNAQGVIAAPDILNGTPAQNKAIFDRMVRSLVAPAVNACVEAVEEVQDAETGVKEAEEKRKTAETERAEAEENRSEAEQDRETAEQERREAEENRQNAETGYVKQAQDSAVKAESWAVGGTGTREGEDANNAKYWAERAKNAAMGGDMKAETYDPQGKARDVFKYVDDGLATKAPAGYGGFGEVISYGGGFSSDESFIEWITGEISSIPSGASKQVRFALSYQFDTNTWADYFAGADWYGTLTNEAGYGTLVVSSYSGFNSMGTYQMVRNFYNNVWSPWEAVNPPMEVSVEYRTTERYMGKPVYVKAVNIGALPNATTKCVSHGVGVAMPIDCRGIMSNSNSIPFVNSDKRCEIAADSAQIVVTSNFDASAQTGVAIMKYYKSTD